MDGLKWRRSSKCDGGACVEVSTSGDVIVVRRSGDPTGAIIYLDAGKWREFVSEVQAGRFDSE